MEKDTMIEEIKSSIISLKVQVNSIQSDISKINLSINDFNSEKETLLSEVKKDVEKINAIIIQTKKELETTFETFATQKKQEIISAANIAKTEIDTHKNEVDSKINAFFLIEKYILKNA